MRLDMPLFKIVQRPILPVYGSWVDAAPFVIFFGILIAAHLARRYIRNPRRLKIARRIIELLSAFVFIIFLHRCLCMLRGWIFALKMVGKNDVIAFGHLCMFALLTALTLAAGRLFCGWLCPLGFLSELISGIPARRSRLPEVQRLVSGYLTLCGSCLLTFWLAYMVRPGTQFFSENVAAMWSATLLVLLFAALPMEHNDYHLKKIKYISLTLWMFLSVVGVFVTSPWCTLFGDEVDYSSAVALLAVILASTVVPMAWCRYICPMGAALGWLAKHSPIRVLNPNPCTHCGRCRQICPMGALQDGHSDPTSCVLCGSCIGTCGFHWSDTSPKDEG